MTNIVEHTIEELVLLIEQWAEDRNIINGTKPIDQAMKLFSEFGELADNVGKGRDCRDDIGDVFVVLTIMCKQTKTMYDLKDMFINETIETIKEHVAMLGMAIGAFVSGCHSNSLIYAWYKDSVSELMSICNDLGYTLEECVQIAYKDIKDRVGVVYNGVYIKSTDIAYEGALKALGKL